LKKYDDSGNKNENEGKFILLYSYHRKRLRCKQPLTISEYFGKNFMSLVDRFLVSLASLLLIAHLPLVSIIRFISAKISYPFSEGTFTNRQFFSISI